MMDWSSVIPRVAAFALFLVAPAACGGKVEVDGNVESTSSSGSSGGDGACCSQGCCTDQVAFLQSCGMNITCDQVVEQDVVCLCQSLSLQACDEVMTCISPSP
jgi:ABC-type Fe3+-hydroxamate transport system substrate-binding protein